MDLSALINLPWKTIIPILISFAALTVSVLTWYFNNLSSFRPLITTGFPIYHFAKLNPIVPIPEGASGIDYDPIKERILGAIIISFIITHRGGRSGVISDIMLRITHDQESTKWYFEPRLNMNQKFYIPQSAPKEILQAMDSPFAPIPIAKGQEARRIILFQAKNNEKYPYGRLRIGKYNVQVLCRFNQKHRFKVIYKTEVDFSKEVLRGLEPVGNYVPEPKSVIDVRKQLYGSGK